MVWVFFNCDWYSECVGVINTLNRTVWSRVTVYFNQRKVNDLFRRCVNVPVCLPQFSVCQHVQSFHTGRQLLAAEKALLMKLRKSTGYTFTNCKKALEKFDNDITQVPTSFTHPLSQSVIHVHTHRCWVIIMICYFFFLGWDLVTWTSSERGLDQSKQAGRPKNQRGSRRFVYRRQRSSDGGGKYQHHQIYCFSLTPDRFKCVEILCVFI